MSRPQQDRAQVSRIRQLTDVSGGVTMQRSGNGSFTEEKPPMPEAIRTHKTAAVLYLALFIALTVALALMSMRHGVSHDPGAFVYDG